MVSLTTNRYGPRQSKSTVYNERGKLNIEVKFAPFSCTHRRSPLHVSPFVCSADFDQTEQNPYRRMPKTDPLLLRSINLSRHLSAWNYFQSRL